MISYQVEPYGLEILEDIKPLLDLHYEEIAMHKEHIPLDPDWDKYKRLADQNMLFIATARADGVLVGYSVFFIIDHMHYRSTKMASNDVLFLHPEHRLGTTGIKLIKFCERELLQLNVVKVMWHIKFAHDFRKILYRLGYNDEDAIVGKILKE
jgi:hypothetical protein